MAILKVSGQIKSTNTNAPVQNVKIELWDAVTDGYGWLSSTSTDNTGGFSLSFNGSIASLIRDEIIELQYKVYKNDQLIVEAPVTDYTTEIEIPLSESALDSHMVYPAEEAGVSSFVRISGNVKDINGAAVANVIVNVYETVFPSRQFIATTTTNLLGNYSITINRRLIGNSNVLAKRGLVVEVVDNEAIPNITTSSNIFDWETSDNTIVDIRTETTNSTPVFSNLVSAIETITDATPLADLTEQQIEYIAGAIGQSKLGISNIVSAHKLAAETSQPADYFHAFILLGNYDQNSLVALKPANAREIIAAAKNANLINDYTEPEIDSFLSAFKDYQIQKTKDAPVTGESYTMDAVFDAIFPVTADKNNFLSLYMDDFETMSEFWNDIYIPAYGEAAAAKAQQGLKVAAVSFMQPKIMARLATKIDEFDTPHISQLAKWDLDTWTSIISDVCTTENELCVPAVVRGEETDPENTAIHEQYALKMRDIMNRSFPLINITGVLEGGDGSTLIADETSRLKVATFLNANPLLDLRLQSIHDINADDFDIDEEDVEEIKNELAPFQRLLRLVDGNPEAICTLVADGVNSAKAIADMGREQFIETYGDLFPPEETGPSESLISPRLSTGSTFGLPPAGAVFGGAYSVGLATSVSVAGVLTGSGSPVFPPVFPGGFTTLPTDSPVLSALFGGMDYCTCSDCKSVVSPAAYLSDLLHFLQTKAPAVYSALADKRPDILSLDLSCKNAETTMPYIDIVTELLELQILKPLASTPASTDLNCEIVLKPVMKVVPTTSANPLTTGTYQFAFKGAPGFINKYPLLDSYAGHNPMYYISIDSYLAAETPALVDEAAVTNMYDKYIPYVVDTYGTGMMMLWSKFPFTTTRFSDYMTEHATVAPLIILDDNSQNVIDYLIADINIEIIETTPSNVKIRVIRSHPDVTVDAITGITMTWYGSVSSVSTPPDPDDPLNPDKTILVLTPGTYSIGVLTNYHFPVDETEFPHIMSYTSIFIEVGPMPPYIPGGDFSKFSFQTSGTRAQLQAYPERTYKEAGSGLYKDFTTYAMGIPYKRIYDSNNLGGAVYPFALPFNLAIEETRTYIQHFGISRYKAMKLFMPVNQEPDPAPNASITDYTTYAEWLGLSQVAATIVDGSFPFMTTNLWMFYGFTAGTPSTTLYIKDPNSYAFIYTTTSYTAWQALLSSRLDILLQQTLITYDELLQLLSTEFVNPTIEDSTARKVSIVPIPGPDIYHPTPVDTCRLDMLRLNFVDPEYPNSFYLRLHRFIRLVKTGRMTIYQWDILLKSMKVTELNTTTFKQVGKVLLLADEIDVDPTILACWWNDIDITNYRNFPKGTNEKTPSLYERVFSDKAVLNFDNINYFKNPLNLPEAFILDTLSFAPQIANMCGITEKEVVSLLNYLDIYDLPEEAVTLNSLSRVYILSVLAKKFKYSIPDFLAVLTYWGDAGSGTTIVTLPNLPSNSSLNAYVENLRSLCNLLTAIKSSGFSITELSYILRHTDNQKVVAPAAARIRAFYESLRNDLQKQAPFPPPAGTPDGEVISLYNSLKEIICRHFCKEFAIPLQWAEAILHSNTGDAYTLVDNCLKKEFINSTYNLTEEKVQQIDALATPAGEEMPAPFEGNIKPDFLLHSLYDWYIYGYKIVLTARKLKLKLAELEYLFFYPEAANFDFSTLPVNSLNETITASTPPAVLDLVNGLMRISRLAEVARILSLPETGMGRMADAARGVLSPSSVKYSPVSLADGELPPAPIATSDPDYDTLINNCFVNWIDIIVDALGRGNVGGIIDELIGDNVSATGLTEGSSYTDTLLKLYFSADTAESDFAVDNYNNISLVLRIKDILYWSKRIGMNPRSVHKVLVENVDLNDSRNLIIAAKGKYEDTAWAEIAKPLRDTIRIKQRDALVAYTITKPNVIYSNLLIDVEMEACMATSRIKQALSSVQLLVDRVIMGLEYADAPGSAPATMITMPALAKSQWEQWRKWYAIWRGNREIFLYPENWMEPSLRNDKSSFFEDLEASMRQDEVTQEKAEDAFKAYLQKLEEVSRLEPVGTCYQKDSGNRVSMHVFSRTYGTANKYYYRKLQPNSIWTPWSKIDIDIQSEHVVPYVWNNRLFLFWLTFTEKLVPSSTSGPVYKTPSEFPTYSIGAYFNNDYWRPMKDNTDGGTAIHRKVFEITLNWSEYKKGKWQNQRTSSEKITLKMRPDLQNVLETVYTNSNTERNLFSFLTNNNQAGVSEFIKSRIYLHPRVPYAGSITLLGDTPKYGDLYLMVMFPAYLYDPVGVGSVGQHYEFADNMKAFHFNGDLADVPTNVTFRSRIVPTEFTFFKNQSLVNYRNPVAVTNDQLKIDNYLIMPTQGYIYDKNLDQYFSDNWRNSTTTILGKTVLGYRLFPRAGFKNPIAEAYMYEDADNTYFARLADTNFASALSSDGTYLSLSSITTIASAAYLGPGEEGGYVPLGGLSAHTGGLTSHAGEGVAYTGGPTKHLFQTFYHSHVKTFLKVLNEHGIKGLMRPDLLPTPLNIQNPGDTMNFLSKYLPNAEKVNLTVSAGTPLAYYNQVPTNKVDFFYNGTYASYNWELFYHIPMLIADRLSSNQQFKEAQQWYHYIFDPTKYAATSSPNRYWVFQPFYELASASISTLDGLLASIHAGSAGAMAQVSASADDPFQPYTIGKMRPIAFMKNTLMKYLDNLIAWGDYLFARDTIESINEATQLYILASNMLGRKPQAMAPRVETATYSYRDLTTAPLSVDELGLATVPVETYIAPASAPPPTSSPALFSFNVSYFCLTANDKLLRYWDTVADRLFKIRNCQNLAGNERQLPLFEAPINPLLLVQAAANGMSADDVLNMIYNGNSPNYRFSYMVQKANEFCADVKGLGNALLSALEKKDAEELSLLRQGHEMKLLDAMLNIKKVQIDEAKASLDALIKTRSNVLARKEYYDSRKFKNASETQHLNSLAESIDLQEAILSLQEIGAAYSMIPQFHSTPVSVGPSFGGQQLSTMVNMGTMALSAELAINNIVGSMAATTGGYERRMDDWKFQAVTAKLEMEQIEKQIIAANIRIDIVTKEYENQQLQIENSKEIDTFLRTKYTGTQLYDWMIKEISGTYFLAYKAAVDMAKKAEQCYKNELPLSSQALSGFIRNGSWNSLRSGLLAGEKLQYDIRNMEAAYLTENKRTLELTKHVSLAMLNPKELMKLRTDGECTILIPEELYDIDYPTHYNRRIKSFSISIPCVAGPYTTIPCTVSHNSSLVRTDYGDDYSAFETITASGIPCSTIATSSAQNDSGMFEVNFRDERYLPFEGAGAICNLSLELGGG